MRIGHIAQVIGPVVDVKFPISNGIPEIHNALVVVPNQDPSQVTEADLNNPKNLVLEVALDLGEGIVRTIAMSATDGLSRDTLVVDRETTIKVPAGNATLGRVCLLYTSPSPRD